MRWGLAIVLLCACNQAFGIRETRASDASQVFFDAPIDAPYQCPPIGTTPRFSSLLHQVIPQYCTDYSFSAASQRALAVCVTGPYSRGFIYQGTIDGSLTAAPGFPTASDITVSQPRIDPEGEEVVLATFDLTNTVAPFAVFRAQTDGSWSRLADLPIPQFGIVSGRTRGPNRHLLHRKNVQDDLDEWAEQSPGTWNKVNTHRLAALGVTAVDELWISPDGLRVIMNARTATTPNLGQVMYADRASMTDAFNAAVALDNVPAVHDAFMTEDCARIYLSGLQQIFYVQQL
jgi:hypothetical protein